jgi:hypothetical protein
MIQIIIGPKLPNYIKICTKNYIVKKFLNLKLNQITL